MQKSPPRGATYSRGALQNRLYWNKLTASLNAFPGTNLGIFRALMEISAPVRGFLPFLAFLPTTLKVPKPARVTIPFFFNVLVMVEKTQSTAAWACFLVFTTLATSLSKSPVFCDLNVEEERERKCLEDAQKQL